MRILDNVINIVLPSINPDGTQIMVTDWYMKTVGTPVRSLESAVAVPEVLGPRQQPRRFALNLPESKYIGKLLYRDWMPQAYMDHHQMGSGNARIFIPPYAEPIRPDRRSAGVARDQLVRRAHGEQARGRRQDRA